MKITSTNITVENIEIFACHGVFEQERQIGNEFLVTVSLDYNAEAAMRYDDPEQALNYAEVIDIVKRVMAVPSMLLEHVAQRLIAAFCEAFPTLEGGYVSVTKVHPPVSTKTGGATFMASFRV